MSQDGDESRRSATAPQSIFLGDRKSVLSIPTPMLSPTCGAMKTVALLACAKAIL